MQVGSVCSEIIKILFDTSKEQLLIGDLIKIVNRENNGVIAQVIKIESLKSENLCNEASAKILFSHNAFGNWIQWNGNVPSKEYTVVKIKVDELLSYITGTTDINAVSLGQLSLYPDRNLTINASKLGFNTVVFCDNQEQRLTFSALLASELNKINAKTVILDFRGEFSDIPNAVKLTAGKDFKLPLSSKGIESLYEKGLSNISPETRAIIEDIFIEVQDYAESSENGCIPFFSFKNVVDDEYKESKITGLVLLKNSLEKYSKQGIFANTGQEIEILKKSLNKANFVVIDLSGIQRIWYKDFIDHILNSNIDKYNQQFSLIFEADGNIDDDLMTKLYVKGISSGIRPIIFAGYKSKFTGQLLSVAKNLILYAPRTYSDRFSKFENYFTRLNSLEALAYGSITNNIPLFVKTDINIQAQTHSSTKQENITTPVKEPEPPHFVNDNQVSEVLPDNSNNEKIESAQEIYRESSADAPYENVYDLSSEVVEVEEISQDYALNYDFLDQNPDEILSQSEFTQLEPEKTEIIQGISPDTSKEIQKDVESLYTSQKSPLDYDEFSLSDEEITEEESAPAYQPVADIPVYSTPESSEQHEFNLQEGDKVKHQKYGVGMINKIIGYGNKKLCSIQFENVGRRLLDPQLAVLEKV